VRQLQTLGKDAFEQDPVYEHDRYGLSVSIWKQNGDRPGTRTISAGILTRQF
jgi:hypothetical protein